MSATRGAGAQQPTEPKRRPGGDAVAVVDELVDARDRASQPEREPLLR